MQQKMCLLSLKTQLFSSASIYIYLCLQFYYIQTCIYLLIYKVIFRSLTNLFIRMSELNETTTQLQAMFSFLSQLTSWILRHLISLIGFLISSNIMSFILAIAIVYTSIKQDWLKKQKDPHYSQQILIVWSVFIVLLVLYVIGTQALGFELINLIGQISFRFLKYIGNFVIILALLILIMTSNTSLRHYQFQKICVLYEVNKHSQKGKYSQLFNKLFGIIALIVYLITDNHVHELVVALELAWVFYLWYIKVIKKSIFLTITILDLIYLTIWLWSSLNQIFHHEDLKKTQIFVQVLIFVLYLSLIARSNYLKNISNSFQVDIYKGIQFSFLYCILFERTVYFAKFSRLMSIAMLACIPILLTITSSFQLKYDKIVGSQNKQQRLSKIYRSYNQLLSGMLNLTFCAIVSCIGMQSRQIILQISYFVLAVISIRNLIYWFDMNSYESDPLQEANLLKYEKKRKFSSYWRNFVQIFKYLIVFVGLLIAPRLTSLIDY